MMTPSSIHSMQDFSIEARFLFNFQDWINYCAENSLPTDREHLEPFIVSQLFSDAEPSNRIAGMSLLAPDGTASYLVSSKDTTES